MNWVKPRLLLMSMVCGLADALLNGKAWRIVPYEVPEAIKDLGYVDIGYEAAQGRKNASH